MKLKLFVIALFISLGLSSQIRIGQPIDETIYFLNHLIKMKRNWNVEKKYKNGKIEEVIINKRNQYYYEFNLRTDAVERLIVDNNGNYAYSLRQFPELSLDFIKEKFNKAYKSYKVDDFYFTEDFSHFMKLGLIDNYATIMYAKARMELFPKSMENKILKQKVIATEKQKEYQKEADYIEKLENDYFDINEFNPDFVKELHAKIIKAAIVNLDYDIGKLKVGEQKEIKGVFSYEIKAKKNSSRSSTYSNIKKIDKNNKSFFFPTTLEEFIWKIPYINKSHKGREYELNRYTKINLVYDMVVGYLEVKNRKSKVKYLTENNLKDEQKKILQKILKKRDRGNYKIYYQIGTINKVDADRYRVIKL